jgi:SPP1 gp7 family putative phage head morphogenesis protein
MAKNQKALPSRNREDLLKVQHEHCLKVAKELDKVRKAVVARVRATEHKMAKDVGEPLANLVTGDDFQNLKATLQKQDLETYQMGVAAAGTVLDATQEMLKLANERGIAWAEQHAGELITQVEATTKDGVRELVDQALNEGWSNQSLAAELDDAWEFGTERAELIARTETAMADKKGNIEISREAGVQEVQWLAAEAGACDQCEALDGQKAPIDGEFPDGTKADDIAHPDCRCDVVAILPNESED